MAIIQTITRRALPIETSNRFSSTFNAYALGQYNFTRVAANQNQVVIETNPRYIYLVDRLSFSASIGEGDYLRSIVPGNEPGARFKFRNSPRYIYPQPFPGINYKDNLALSFWFQSQKENDALLVDFMGILDQIPTTVGVTNIYAQLSLVVYQEMIEEVTHNMRQPLSDQFGTYYRRGLDG